MYMYLYMYIKQTNAKPYLLIKSNYIQINIWCWLPWWSPVVISKGRRRFWPEVVEGVRQWWPWEDERERERQKEKSLLFRQREK